MENCVNMLQRALKKYCNIKIIRPNIFGEILCFYSLALAFAQAVREGIRSVFVAQVIFFNL